MVATPVLLLVQVPPVVGVKVTVLPLQTVVGPPIVGAVGTAPITTLELATEVHPLTFVTVNVYVAPAGKPVIVVVVPDPVVVTFPGFLVIVHDPDGKPLKATLPVVVVHVGCVIAPIVGAEGNAVTVIVPVVVLFPS